MNEVKEMTPEVNAKRVEMSHVMGDKVMNALGNPEKWAVVYGNLNRYYGYVKIAHKGQCIDIRYENDVIFGAKRVAINPYTAGEVVLDADSELKEYYLMVAEVLKNGEEIAKIMRESVEGYVNYVEGL